MSPLSPILVSFLYTWSKLYSLLLCNCECPCPRAPIRGMRANGAKSRSASSMSSSVVPTGSSCKKGLRRFAFAKHNQLTLSSKWPDVPAHSHRRPRTHLRPADSDHREPNLASTAGSQLAKPSVVNRNPSSGSPEPAIARLQLSPGAV